MRACSAMDSAMASGAMYGRSNRPRRTYKNMRKRVVSVIGGHKCKPEVEQLAIKLAKKLAKVVDILVSGGLSGTIKLIFQ